ncbi:hypothetical protein KAK07_22600 [Ideonella sp. 4Y16]|nr:PKD domain-containing protein [Ideonella alba]MBQ0946149.1 hypothetical protein [Ideonella alba]
MLGWTLACLLMVIAGCGGGDGASNPDPGPVARPVASINMPSSATAGSTITADGTGSRAMNGGTLTFHWRLVGPAGSKAVLDRPADARPSFMADQPGTYQVALRVEEAAVSSDEVTRDVTVAPLGNAAPVAQAGSDQEVPSGAPVFLDGSASYDPDGDPITYVWSVQSAPPGASAAFSSPAAVRPGFFGSAPGTYVLALVVTDSRGNASVAASVRITLQVAQVVPLANVVTANTAEVGREVAFDGSGSTSAPGLTLSYAWTLTARPATSAAQLNASGSLAKLIVDVEGTYVVSLVVNDGTRSSAPATASVKAERYNLGTLGLAGVWQTVEDVPVDVAFFGQRAPNVNSVALSGRGCSKDYARSNSTLAVFSCQAPHVDSGTDRFDYLSVTSTDTPQGWQSGPIYTSSRAYWRNYNGELYVERLAAYVLSDPAMRGVMVQMIPNALSGNYGDINYPQLYSAIKLNEALCPKVADRDWTYQCPPLPYGTYAVSFLFDGNTRYLAGQAYLVNISSDQGPIGGDTINGICGSSDGKVLSTAPTNDLCVSGTPSALAGSGPWTWSCTGSGEGHADANCRANYAPPAPKPQ